MNKFHNFKTIGEIEIFLIVLIIMMMIMIIMMLMIQGISMMVFIWFHRENILCFYSLNSHNERRNALFLVVVRKVYYIIFIT